MILETGDAVAIIDGDLEGSEGEVSYFDEHYGYYVVNVEGENVDKLPEEVVPIIELVEEPPTEEVPPFGMSSEQLAYYAEQMLRGCTQRITGVGHQQYAEERFQKFETMSPLEVLDNLEEEILDIPNYCVFLYILIQRMKKGIGEASIG